MATKSFHWRNAVLLALVTALCFGGTFICKTSTHDNDGNGSSGAVILP